MKILHTSDLHLGKILYNQDLVENHQSFFNQLNSIVEEERPDALLISGDIYETSNPTVAAKRMFNDNILRLHATLPSMSIIVISGNHDSAQRIGVDSPLWKLANVYIFSFIDTLKDKSPNYASHIVTLRDDKGKPTAYIGAIPFAYDQNFPKSDLDENRIKAFYKGICAYVREQNKEKVPFILMGHLTIDANLDITGHKSDTIGGVESLKINDITSQFDYLALGHIHRPQFIHETDHKVRYCGTPIAVSFDEPYEHSISIVSFNTDNIPNITTKAITPPHQLVTIPEEPVDFREALRLLKEYPAEKQDFIRLNVLSESAPSDAMSIATNAMSDKGSQFLTINYVRNKANEEAAKKETMTLSEFKSMTPIEIAKLHLGNDFTEEMESTFNEVLRMLND